MAIKRMDNVLIFVDDLEAAKAFFIAVSVSGLFQAWSGCPASRLLLDVSQGATH
jgi:hypothetical protein